MTKLVIFSVLAVCIPLFGVSQKIQANIDFDKPRLCMGDSVNLDASNSRNADNHSWEVFVNDTLLLEVDIEKLVYTPLEAGVFKVVLEVSNVQKETDRDTVIFEVISIPKVGAGTYDSLCKSNLHFAELNKGFPRGATGQWYYVGFDKNIDSNLWKQHSGYFNAGNYAEGRHYLVYKFRIPKTQCAGLDTTSIVVNPIPQPYATHTWKSLRGSNRVCETDSSILLTGNVAEDGELYTDYEWSGIGVEKRSGGYYFVPGNRSLPFNIEYTATNRYGCKGVYKEAIVADESPIVDFEYRVTGTEAKFVNTSVGARSYLWQFSKVDSIERGDATFDFVNPGVYDVTLTSKDYAKQLGACRDTFITKQIHIWPTSIPELQDISSVYPNPFANELTIDLLDEIQYAELNMYNSRGELVYRNQVLPAVSKFNLEHLPTGLYSVQLVHEKGTSHQVVVKQ